jgi:ligand-binding sensor domain-containing protein/signal transduction histidine kinase
MRRRKGAETKRDSPRSCISTARLSIKRERRLRFPITRLRSYISVRSLTLFFLTLYALASIVALADEAGDDSSARAKNLHQWGAVTLFHGLPSDRVHAIAQDLDGVMWFGTERGLAKYDGRRTQAIASEGPLAGRVLALKVDADGVLWVGTSGGAARLFRGEFQTIAGTEGKPVTAIVTPERGRTLLAVEQGLIFECKDNSDGTLAVRSSTIQPPPGVDRPASLRLTSLASLSNDLLFVGTHSRGLLKFEGDAFKDVPSRPRPFFINAVATDAENRLWLGAQAKRQDSGLFDASDPLHPKKVGDGLGTVTALGVDERGELWVGTDGQGAFHYRSSQRLDHFTFAGTAGGLRSDNILAVFVDREGVVWLGTDRGVCRYDPRSPRNEDVSTDSEGNFVRTLYQTRDGQLLCGTNRGLFAYDNAKSSWQPFPQFINKTIYAIAEDAAGRLLIGSSSGLSTDVKPSPDSSVKAANVDAESKSVEKNQEAARASGESVRAIRVFQNATYIATFGRGLERLGKDNRRTLLWPTDERDARLREVTSLHNDANQRLWIGTAQNGVFVFDGKQFTQDSKLDKMKGKPVRDIEGNSEQGLWFATSGGLYGYRAGALLEVAPNSDVRQIIPAREQQPFSDIWCATVSGGLLKIVVDEQFGVLLSQLDVEQGLSSQKAFALLEMREGSGDETLLIGTTRGLVRYSPGKTAPTLMVTRILSRRVHQTDELRRGIELDYPQNSLALDVAALSSRTYPEQFQYAFLLRDGEGRVIKRKLSPDSQFLMENLLPGRYRVEVRAFTKDLIASAPLAFEFSVAKAPFPWTTAALSVLLALALIALVWAIVEHRRITRASTALAGANHELASARLELANEAERERRRIARDLHDQTLADLRHLLMLTDKLPTEANGNGQGGKLNRADFRTEIEAVSGEIRRICEDLSPSVLENVGLAAALEWALANSVARTPGDCKFEYEFVCDEGIEERVRLAPGVKIQIYRIAQEVINNICRHSGATRVRLAIDAPADGSFVLTIEDNGQNFNPRDRKAKRGRGLANILARASLIEADISWGRSESGGTSFNLRKPNVIKGLPAEIST